MRYLITCSLLMLSLFCKGQVPIINTYAGNGTAINSGDGGPALSAGIRLPRGVTFDLAGNLLIYADSLIRKVDKVTGIITTIAGNPTATTPGDGGLATSALLISAQNVVMDKAGDLYLTDENRIRKINMATGIINSYAGTGGMGDSGDGGPAVSATFRPTMFTCLDTVLGYLYVSSENNHRVRKINLSTGIISACAGTGTVGALGDGGLALAAQLSSPTGLCTDKFGNLYISDGVNNTIRKVDAATGIITKIAGTTGLPGTSGDGGLATSATLPYCYSMSADSCGNIYLLSANSVRKIDAATGIIDKIAGLGPYGFLGDGGPAWSARFALPHGLKADNAGHLYIADRDNNRIRIVTIPPVDGTPSITTASTTICPVPATFNANVAGGVGVGYQWIVNGTAVSGATNSSHTYAPANGDSIRCIVVTAGHCNGTVTLSSNMLTMAVIDCPLGAPSDMPQGEEMVRVQPNPNKGTFTISSALEGRATITDFMGRKIQTFSVNAGKPSSVSMHDAAAGVYFLKVETEHGNCVMKVVVE